MSETKQDEFTAVIVASLRSMTLLTNLDIKEIIQNSRTAEIAVRKQHMPKTGDEIDNARRMLVEASERLTYAAFSFTCAVNRANEEQQ